MDYKTRRYREGLQGKKPSVLYFDKAAHRAQVAGYKAHLRNQDLAEKIRRESDTSTSPNNSDSYTDTSSESLKWWHRLLCLVIAPPLLYGDFLFSRVLADYYMQTNAFFPFWAAFAFYFVIFPGCFLGVPAYVLIAMAFSDL